ncbi:MULTISPECIES: fatty acid desaturase family protein [Burkholderia]|uniref:Fatty acid desaturase family protein n=1 Tax=Burkholderia sola TaxID=2843302 RepID=A0ABV2C902_9BURK|nr:MULTISPECIES: fatty acid desaturase family protein [unclassified Burkholderia]MBP0607657.1 fatty acid desaturase family protein [Burkholderia sp. CpTa8-5]MBP0717627.1 fatty acid desaturase family protein [Burkholderia sp. AcTa6-5]
MNNADAVATDASIVHRELDGTSRRGGGLRNIDPVRPVLDVAFDWAVIVVAAACGYRYGTIAAIAALFVIGNRQRALGNLLHEAGHRNLYRDRRLGDTFAKLFIAPALLMDLERYRATHARHHAMLGSQENDPDYIAPRSARTGWWATYRGLLFSRDAWIGAVAGHCVDPQVGVMRRMRLVAWWIALSALLTAVAGHEFAIFVLVLWHLAKATTFHAITTLREMCDHYGLARGGIYSFTRDTTVARYRRWIIHPHNNGFHLTHHLLPSVPYYRLPAAQNVLSSLPSYRARGMTCTAYFFGRDAVVLKCHRSVEAA